MEMQDFLAMVNDYDLSAFDGAYFEINGEVTGTFADDQPSPATMH